MAPSSENSVRARTSRVASPPPLRAASAEQKPINTKDCISADAEKSESYTIEDSTAITKQPAQTNSAAPMEHSDEAQGRHSVCSKRMALALFAAAILCAVIYALVWLQEPLVGYMNAATGQVAAVLQIAVQQVKSNPMIFSSLLAIPTLIALIGMGVAATWWWLAASHGVAQHDKEKSV